MSFSPSRLYAGPRAKSNFFSKPLISLYNTIVTPLKENNAAPSLVEKWQWCQFI